MALHGRLKQSTAATIVLGPFLDTADGFTTKTALTIAQADVRLSKNAGAFAQKGDATSATHMENGCYSCPVSTTDTNTCGILVVVVVKAGALPFRMEFEIVPANAYDSDVGGTATRNVNVITVETDGSSPATDAIETGVTLKQALRAIASATAGRVSGADALAPNFKAIGNAGTTRIAATGDNAGNRTAITLTL